MARTRINQTARGPGFLPTKKISALRTRKIYRITNFRKVKIEFGNGMLARVDKVFEVILPTHIAKSLYDDPVYFQEMVQAAKDDRLQMHYLGYQYIEFNYNLKDGFKRFNAMNHLRPRRPNQPEPSVADRTAGFHSVTNIAPEEEAGPSTRA